MVDHRQHVTYLNPAAEKLLDRSEPEILASSFSALSGLEGTAACTLLRRCMARSRAVVREELQLATGTWVEMRAVPREGRVVVCLRELRRRAGAAEEPVRSDPSPEQSREPRAR